MLKKCKWCGKEQEMNGKKEYCDKTCRDKYRNALKAGKITEVEKKTGELPQEPDCELVGRVVKVTTTPQGKNLAHIEFDLEESKSIAEYWSKPARVFFYNEIENGEEEEKDDLLD